VQEEGPFLPFTVRPLRISQFLRPALPDSLDETVPLRRALFWVVVGLGVVVGIVLYFRYARLLTPLLG
jgi:hypothetical protein